MRTDITSLIAAGRRSSFGEILAANRGELGGFSVSAEAATSPSDIAKAAALSYHLDIETDGQIFKNVRTSRWRRIKSKFAKRSLDVEEDFEIDPDVDAAEKEGEADNDTKMRRLLNIHLAKKAETNARLARL